MAEKSMEDHLIEISQYVFKTIIMINGGATIALLAFIGNIWNKDGAYQLMPSLAISMASFASAVLCGALGTGVIYICNMHYAKGLNFVAGAFRAVAIILAIGSYVLFGCGIYYTYQALR